MRIYQFDRESPSEGHAGFLYATRTKEGVLIAVRQHGGPAAGESIEMTLDEARALADALHQTADE